MTASGTGICDVEVHKGVLGRLSQRERRVERHKINSYEKKRDRAITEKESYKKRFVRVIR